MVAGTVTYEVLAGGPWLSIVVFDRQGACNETLVLDTMQVVSIGTRYLGDEPGAARITTTAGIYVVPDGASKVALWIIAARRGAAHPDVLFDYTPESEEIRGE